MITVPTSRGFLVGARASLVEDGQILRAWAERHVRRDPDIRWIVGNYVEAEAANSNGHIFPLSELVTAQHTLAGKPLNMLHRERHIVGFFAGAQLLDSNGLDWKSTSASSVVSSADANGPMANPYVEAVAGLWHARFPEEYFEIECAHKEGTLFFSMEAIPENVSCPSCQLEAAFEGFESASYCEHMQGPTGPKRLHNPVFAGGAIIIPPLRPGWNRADIKSIAQMLHQQDEDLVAAVAAELPGLQPAQWEWLMAQILDLVPVAREFKTKERQELADKGNAMPDGSFPIKSRQDVKNAIQAIGRAKNPGPVKAHIKKMARKLGCEELIPEGW